MPPPRAYLLLSLLLLLASAICSTAQTTEPLPPPPPPGAPRPPHRHRHVAPPGSPLTPPPAGLPPPPPPPPRRRHAPATPTPVAVQPAQAPPPTPTPTPAPPVVTSPTPKYPSSSANPSTDPYPFTNNPFFPTVTPPPPPPAAETQPSSSGDGGVPTFPANISTLVAPTRASGSHRFPVLQALLLSLLSLCLLLLSALLSIHLVRRLRHHGRSRAAASTAAAGNRRAASSVADDDDGDEEGRRLKPPPMPTSSSNPSTEFLYLGTLANPPQAPGTSSSLRPGSPELRPLPPLPRVGPPSGEFASRSSASDPSTVPHAAAADASSSSLSPSSPSASSPTLGSSPVHIRPPTIPQPRGRAPNPSPPKRRPSPPKGAAEPVAAHAWNPFVPVPPRAAVASSDDGDSDDKDVRKSRPLHSDKLNPSSLHMKDEVIQLYLNNSAAVAAPREVCLLGAARCHGIGMVVGALGVSREQLRDALLEGNAHGLGVEALRMLTQMVLSNEEELKLKYFKDDSLTRLCPVEAFVKAMLDVPFAFKRVDAMLYIASFYLEVNQLRLSYATVEGACQEMRSSRLFHKVVEAVMNFGNFMSINAGSPSSHCLEPNTVLKIVDVKGADGKAALVQFVVQEILKPEGHDAKCSMVQGDAGCRKHGLEVVSKLAAELSNTKKAASIDIVMLSRSVSDLGMGLGKVHDVMRLNSMVTSADSARRFHNSMSTFLKQAEEEILKLQSQESLCLSSVKEMAEYFHGDSVKDEARMLRVFAGVREFLAMLDRICKEAGEISDNSWVGSTTASWTAAPMGMTP
ncbi:hypothetical protein HU200_053257 [Digitaria exilis]|uniref:Formin-like protein n=1 Tax=Digitaria exilis TaxID=1010633 RepID=A0A835AHR3_9POAL|nr:hypothetical protein HU200_053257 [Digitaria exilis]